MSFLTQILIGFAHFFVGAFATLLSSDEGKQLEQEIASFVKTDVGKLAVDAVQYASTLPDKDNNALRAAAVTKLRGDLTTCGKDGSAILTSTLNLFIEMAFTYVAGVTPKLIATAAGNK